MRFCAPTNDEWREFHRLAMSARTMKQRREDARGAIAREHLAYALVMPPPSWGTETLSRR